MLSAKYDCLCDIHVAVDDLLRNREILRPNVKLSERSTDHVGALDDRAQRIPHLVGFDINEVLLLPLQFSGFQHLALLKTFGPPLFGDVSQAAKDPDDCPIFCFLRVCCCDNPGGAGHSLAALNFICVETLVETELEGDGLSLNKLFSFRVHQRMICFNNGAIPALGGHGCQQTGNFGEMSS